MRPHHAVNSKSSASVGFSSGLMRFLHGNTHAAGSQWTVQHTDTHEPLHMLQVLLERVPTSHKEGHTQQVRCCRRGGTAVLTRRCTGSTVAVAGSRGARHAACRQDRCGRLVAGRWQAPGGQRQEEKRLGFSAQARQLQRQARMACCASAQCARIQSRPSMAAATAGNMHAHVCTLPLRTSSTAMFSSHHLMGSQKGLGWGSCCRKDSSSVLRRGRGIC